MSCKKLSVIVPVYNTEKYVQECIDSLYKQLGLKLEIIVINDGSTDDSLKILEHIKYKHPDLIILNQNNKGVSAARNYGMSIATGDYITFVDSDDTVDENAYSYIIKNMEKSNSDISIFAFRRCLAEYKIDDILPWDDLEILDARQIRDILIPLMFCATNNKCVISGSVCRSVFRTSLLDTLYFNEKISMQEDLLFCIYAYNRANRIQIINSKKYNYIKHNNTTTERYRKNFYKESLDFEKTQINALKKINIYNSMIWQYQNKRIDIYSLCISNLYRFDAPKNIQNELKEIIEGFNNDEYLSNIDLKKLNSRNKVLYFLLSIRSRKILQFIYKLKEMKRRTKLLQ